MHNRINVFSILSMITLTTVTSGFIYGLSGTSTAHAGDNRGTEAQQLACTPDVFRLCGSQIPDADRIVVCLRQNMTSLSGGCRAVFDAEASVQQAEKPAERTTVAGKSQRTAQPKVMRGPPPAPAAAPLPARPAEQDPDSDE
ncbi:hypothetical protein [Bradyrhizobium prioriisuperbiae]|uniref:hypothetical protein n=1 Tax=Bradyrhizobium prioriisuperbiae TaxID=2854389 RepID=UPI0028E9C6BE|nr:hypothetical protein [Bradyrhizobium prioritasuperba]